MGFLQSCNHVVQTCFGNSEINLRRWEKKKSLLGLGKCDASFSSVLRNAFIKAGLFFRRRCYELDRYQSGDILP